MESVAAKSPMDERSLPDIHADLSERVVADTYAMEWEPSPSGTVFRKPLYREGGEFGPVVSIVRYVPGGHFRAHAHPAGEEILVLDGVFSDETGDYPAGSYLLNPPGSRHSPGSREGCTLFVRLSQYSGEARERVAIATRVQAWRQGLVPGLSVMPLYSSSHYPESMALVHWQPGTHFQRHAHPGGEEILVLDGVFEDEHGRYPAGHWIRAPHMSVHQPFSQEGCLIYVRVGGLSILGTDGVSYHRPGSSV
jgi:anti-sigma factor ChrR (cupin superfamily)